MKQLDLSYKDGVFTFTVPVFIRPRERLRTSGRALLARLALSRAEKRKLRLLLTSSSAATSVRQGSGGL
jgi:hypothetical protein